LALPACLLAQVSIHAPAWGATHDAASDIEITYSFNPRARVGRDMIYFIIYCHIMSFNPRARVGRDTPMARSTLSSMSFNPRARVGRDQVKVRWSIYRPGFNPRARVGRDAALLCLSLSANVSIHAPAWGATCKPWEDILLVPVSIHAPAWGAT